MVLGNNAGVHPDWLNRLNTLLGRPDAWSPVLQPIVEKLKVNEALSQDDGLVLYKHGDLHELGALAHAARTARFGNQAFFNSNVHINHNQHLRTCLQILRLPSWAKGHRCICDER